MNFRPGLAQAILDGRKTVTRRVPSANPRSPWYGVMCGVKAGRSYAVCPGRGKTAIGRVAVTAVDLLPLGHLDDAEARREGFASADEFEAVWVDLNGRYNPIQPVWRIEFRLIHRDDYPLWEGSVMGPTENTREEGRRDSHRL